MKDFIAAKQEDSSSSEFIEIPESDEDCLPPKTPRKILFSYELPHQISQSHLPGK